MAWGVILAATGGGGRRRLLRAANGRAFGPFFFMGTELPGKTLGIIGAGRIGTAVARKASGLGMSAVYWSTPAEAGIRDSDRRHESRSKPCSERALSSLTGSLNAENRTCRRARVRPDEAHGYLGQHRPRPGGRRSRPRPSPLDRKIAGAGSK